MRINQWVYMHVHSIQHCIIHHKTLFSATDRPADVAATREWSAVEDRGRPLNPLSGGNEAPPSKHVSSIYSVMTCTGEAVETLDT